MSTTAGPPCATSFLGHQCRIVTDSTFSKARIKSIDAEGIFGALKKGNVAVVAGFQGVDEEGNVTTLGRGGSDTTAVAIAAAIKAEALRLGFAWGADGSLAALADHDPSAGSGTLVVVRPGGEPRTLAPAVSFWSSRSSAPDAAPSLAASRPPPRSPTSRRSPAPTPTPG